MLIEVNILSTYYTSICLSRCQSMFALWSYSLFRWYESLSNVQPFMLNPIVLIGSARLYTLTSLISHLWQTKVHGSPQALPPTTLPFFSLLSSLETRLFEYGLGLQMWSRESSSEFSLLMDDFEHTFLLEGSFMMEGHSIHCWIQKKNSSQIVYFSWSSGI